MTKPIAHPLRTVIAALTLIATTVPALASWGVTMPMPVAPQIDLTPHVNDLPAPLSLDAALERIEAGTPVLPAPPPARGVLSGLSSGPDAAPPCLLSTGILPPAMGWHEGAWNVASRN